MTCEKSSSTSIRARPRPAVCTGQAEKLGERRSCSDIASSSATSALEVVRSPRHVDGHSRSRLVAGHARRRAGEAPKPSRNHGIDERCVGRRDEDRVLREARRRPTAAAAEPREVAQRAPASPAACAGRVSRHVEPAAPAGAAEHIPAAGEGAARAVGDQRLAICASEVDVRRQQRNSASPVPFVARGEQGRGASTVLLGEGDDRRSVHRP